MGKKGNLWINHDSSSVLMSQLLSTAYTIGQ